MIALAIYEPHRPSLGGFGYRLLSGAAAGKRSPRRLSVDTNLVATQVRGRTRAGRFAAALHLLTSVASVSRHAARAKRAAGFTLIEVVLAIVIALGVLFVLLYFYEQATNLRTQAIQETERIAAARLLLDRITGELRATQVEPSFGQGLVGSSNSIQFVKTDVPSFASWTGGLLSRSVVPVTDLKVVSYRLESPDGTNVAGLFRSEEPLVGKRELLSSDEDSSSISTNAAPDASALPLIEEIRFLQFRYWSGTNWIDSWTSAALPEGVEISLGAEPATNGLDLAEYPAEIFRRVVYLPAYGLTPASAPPPAPSAEKAAATTEGTP